MKVFYTIAIDCGEGKLKKPLITKHEFSNNAKRDECLEELNYICVEYSQMFSHSVIIEQKELNKLVKEILKKKYYEDKS